MYKPRRGRAGHVWRRWAPGASALKMRDNQFSVRDSGTVMFFCGTVPQNVGRLASTYHGQGAFLHAHLGISKAHSNTKLCMYVLGGTKAMYILNTSLHVAT